MHSFDVSTPLVARIHFQRGSCTVSVRPGAATVDVGPEKPGGPALREAPVVTFTDGVLRVEAGKASWPRRATAVRISVGVPEGSTVECTAGSGELSVTGAAGVVVADLGSGDVEVDRGDGLDLRTGSGDIVVHGADGTVRAETGSGRVEIERAGADVDVVNSSGSTAIGHADGDVRVRAESGAVTIRSAGGRSVDVRSASGSVSVGVRQGYRVRTDLHSSSGTIGGDAAGGTAAGDGELDVRVATASGDIDIYSSEG
ncbi:DUF4097 family beta strand repeat-containing protein [Streptomyces sp. NPDC021969]|uniref:DUF4097 family beta strand repeat-containing protein n=1 Tax=unclassified Streptomyces TaxID=2593676 RepID=UPI0033FA0B4C